MMEMYNHQITEEETITSTYGPNASPMKPIVIRDYFFCMLQVNIHLTVTFYCSP